MGSIVIDSINSIDESFEYVINYALDDICYQLGEGSENYKKEEKRCK